MEIVRKRRLAEDIYEFDVKAPLIAQKAQPGHFVIVRHCEQGERIPLTIADSNQGDETIKLVCHGVGKSTKEINQLSVGDSFLDLLGPLGQPYKPEKLGTVLCVAGGLGVAPLYPKVKALKAMGNQTISIVGARSKDLLILSEEMTAVSDQIYYSTDDGSFGHEGFVTDVMRQVLSKEQVDQIIAIGPVPMMNACVKVAKEFDAPIKVSLNAVMIDGTGMCGGCRVSVGDEVKFCCTDGPTFDGHNVDFAELMGRLGFYRDKEQLSLHRCRLEEAK